MKSCNIELNSVLRLIRVSVTILNFQSCATLLCKNWPDQTGNNTGIATQMEDTAWHLTCGLELFVSQFVSGMNSIPSMPHVFLRCICWISMLREEEKETKKKWKKSGGRRKRKRERRSRKMRRMEGDCLKT